MQARPSSPSVQTMFPEDVKEFTSSHKEGSYVLLDVRQPFEYEEQHLPGAVLIPLPQLVDSVNRLDSGKPTIVYCAVGGRSRMAAQLLATLGFQQVYQLEGGIEAWEEPAATGPRELPLRFISGDEPPRDIIIVAYQMEEGLKRFHEQVKARTQDDELKDLLTRLIGAEESHERSLLKILSELGEEAGALASASAAGEVPLMEGGLEVSDFMKKNERFLHTVGGYLELAMMIETQALDLYLRMAAESRVDSTRSVLLHIAEEEKAHLRMLGDYLERQGEKGSLE